MLAPGVAMGGRYRLLERIASGGMGEVWRCEDDVLGRVVALKVVHPAMVNEHGFVERFRAEARVMATISHPGVVSVHDYGESEVPGGGMAPYLVMEYVAGESLHDVLYRAGRLAPEQTMDLIAQAAEALQAAHEHGIVHRDVKPANLLVRSNGRLVLTDFGIARSALSPKLTQTGAVIGTGSYVSPEQALGERAITPASDVYSLGVVAYECLAGRRPFEGENIVDVAMKHVRDEPPPLPADVPDHVRAVVTRAMAKQAAARWPSAAAMARACRTASSAGGVRGGKPAATTVAMPAATRVADGDGGPGEQQGKSRAALVIGVFAAALVAALVVSMTPLGDTLWPAPEGKQERNPASGESTKRSSTPKPVVGYRAMLQASDLEGYRRARFANPEKHRLTAWYDECGETLTTKPLGPGRHQLFEAEASNASPVRQYVDRFPESGGRAYLTEVIKLANTCRERRTEDGKIQLRFERANFADDKGVASSFLIRKISSGGDELFIFVRQGDVVSEIVVDARSENTPYGVTDEQGMTLGVKAAKRLCEVAECAPVQ